MASTPYKLFVAALIERGGPYTRPYGLNKLFDFNLGLDAKLVAEIVNELGQKDFIENLIDDEEQPPMFGITDDGRKFLRKNSFNEVESAIMGDAKDPGAAQRILQDLRRHLRI